MSLISISLSKNSVSNDDAKKEEDIDVSQRITNEFLESYKEDVKMRSRIAIWFMSILTAYIIFIIVYLLIESLVPKIKRMDSNSIDTVVHSVTFFSAVFSFFIGYYFNRGTKAIDFLYKFATSTHKKKETITNPQH